MTAKKTQKKPREKPKKAYRPPNMGNLKGRDGRYLDPFDLADELFLIRELYNAKPRPPFSREQEIAAFKAYTEATGKKKERLENELVLQYLPLCFKYAIQRNIGKEQYADCVAFMLGELAQLIRKYNYDQPVVFTVFAKKRLYFSGVDYFTKSWERSKKEVLHKISEEQTLEGLESQIVAFDELEFLYREEEEE